MYNFFYKRHSFRANRDSTNSGSSLNIPTAASNTNSTTLMDTVAHANASPNFLQQPQYSSNNSLSLHRIAVQPRGNSLQRSQSEAQPDSGQLPERAMSIHSASRPFGLAETQFGRGRRNVRRPSACVATFRGTGRNGLVVGEKRKRWMMFEKDEGFWWGCSKKKVVS